MIRDFINLNGLRKWIRSYRFNLWILEGKEKISGEKLVIVYAGHLANKNYLSYLAFNGAINEKNYGNIWLWTALGLHIKYPESHLVILEIEENLYKKYSDKDSGVYIPCWIDGELYFDDAIDKYKTSENIKSDLRKIEKNKLEYEVTNDRQLFDNFYYQMYVPHITKVHKDRALLMSYKAMMADMDNCDLLLIKQQDEYIAGELLIYENSTVRSWSMGIKDGDARHVKAGAVGALYYYRTSYLSNKGYKSVRMGASRAFLKDGVLQYKNKWATRFIGSRNSGFWLRQTNQEGVGSKFLVNNPFIFLNGAEWEGALFISNVSSLAENQIIKLYKEYYIPGLKHLNIYTSPGNKNQITVPYELSESVLIHNTDKPFS